MERKYLNQEIIVDLWDDLVAWRSQIHAANPRDIGNEL